MPAFNTPDENVRPNGISARLLDHPSGFIPIDLPCRTCNYNLRQQPLDGRCPECGLWVQSSASGAIKNYADRIWLVGVIEGLRGLFVMSIINVFLRVMAWMAMEAGFVVAIVLVLPAELYQYYWLKKVTQAPDPSHLPMLANMNQEALRSYFLIAWCGSLLVAGGPSMVAVWFGGSNGIGFSSAFPVGFGTLAWMLGWCLLFKYLSRLACAIPHHSTERICDAYLQVSAAGVGVAFFAFLSIGVPSVVAAILMSVLALGMMLRLKKLLKRELTIIDELMYHALVTAD